MSYIKPIRPLLISLVALGLVAAWPHAAEAQRRGSGRTVVVRPAVRPTRAVVVVSGFAYPRYYSYYDPSYGWYYAPFYQRGYPQPYGGGYGFGYRDEMTASVRLQVTPKDAQVFVDGYAAGHVDDYDGILQRLRLKPGSHEIALYHSGYRTARQHLYLESGAGRKLELTMEPLRPGDAPDEPPAPAFDPAPGVSDNDGAPRPVGPPRPGPQGGPGPGRPGLPDQSRFGSLALRVQPGDADVFVDGERWNAPGGSDRIVIQLSEGRHHVEIRKDGFDRYSGDIVIRRGETMPLNVSLLRDRN